MIFYAGWWRLYSSCEMYSENGKIHTKSGGGALMYMPPHASWSFQFMTRIDLEQKSENFGARARHRLLAATGHPSSSHNAQFDIMLAFK